LPTQVSNWAKALSACISTPEGGHTSSFFSVQDLVVDGRNPPESLVEPAIKPA
jgi:hypothetical protein